MDSSDKISSYNLFNYFLPGVLFAALADTVTSYNFLQSDLVVGVFVYYFFGLVISRFGSLIIEPLRSGTRPPELVHMADHGADPLAAQAVQGPDQEDVELGAPRRGRPPAPPGRFAPRSRYRNRPAPRPN